MDISFIRSSSLGTWEMCEQKYFLTYVLGHQEPPKKKTVQGTMVHKVMETLALLKMEYQNRQEKHFVYNEAKLGEVVFDYDDFYREEILSDTEVDAINNTRVNKDNYPIPEKCFLPKRHLRIGKEFVSELTDRSFEAYKNDINDKWFPIDKKVVHNWVWMALEYKNGMFDVRRREIFSPEQSFNLEIKRDWSILKNGDYLQIKGTIDLITKINDDTLEVCDWKTGRRYNWGTGKVKDYKSLCKDKQLMLYYYAIRQLFPEYKNIMLTIFFIRDGGPYTIPFNDETCVEFESYLKEKFEDIKYCQKPKLAHYKQMADCCKFCSYKKDDNACKHIHENFELYSLADVTKRFRVDGFDVGTYASPGE